MTVQSRLDDAAFEGYFPLKEKTTATNGGFSRFSELPTHRTVVTGLNGAQ